MTVRFDCASSRDAVVLLAGLASAALVGLGRLLGRSTPAA